MRDERRQLNLFLAVVLALVALVPRPAAFSGSLSARCSSPSSDLRRAQA